MLPATAWLLRKFGSRWACQIYALVFAVIVFLAITLRIEAALFERRALDIASRLSTLQIGITSKSETLSRIPGLTIVSCENKAFNDSDEGCFSLGIPNSKLCLWVLQRASSHQAVFLLLHGWGFRYWSFNAYANFRSGTLSGFGYHTLLSLPHANPVPGGLLVGASSRKRLDGNRLDPVLDESPDYEVVHYFKWPTFQTQVYFTREAPVGLLSHAFNLHLRCVWSLSGCKTANQLLPQAEQDRLRIRESALQRMCGPNQCPTQILPHRARDSFDILLVEVKDVGPTIIKSDFGAAYRFASFRLLRVLKGKAGRPLDNVGVAPEIYVDERLVHNSAIELLKPGQRILLFSGRSAYIDEPCEAMAATVDAVHMLEGRLSASKP